MGEISLEFEFDPPLFLPRRVNYTRPRATEQRAERYANKRFNYSTLAGRGRLSDSLKLPPITRPNRRSLLSHRPNSRRFSRENARRFAANICIIAREFGPVGPSVAFSADSRGVERATSHFL